jgi:5-methylcytosine-specific restriction endonuclease McrA
VRAPPQWVRFLVLQRDGFRCVQCGRSPANEAGVVLHIDHIIPWCDGGATELDNLQTLCDRCNYGKSNLHANASGDGAPISSASPSPLGPS